MDRRSFVAWIWSVKGVESNGNKYCVRYQNWSLGRWLANYIRSQAVGITLATGCIGESGFDPVELWVMGPPCGFFYRSSDILHGHDSKACQGVPCQLCRQQRWYQGRGTKRTIFLLVETRRTNRQSSHPSMVTAMSSTIVIGSYWHSGTPWCLHKQGNITAYIIDHKTG